MKELIEEYGEVLLAMVGATGVLGTTLLLLWGQYSQQVAQYIVGI